MNDFGIFLIWIAAYIVSGIIMGAVTNIILENRGYNDNWFWWGFFFRIIAMIVACSKPQNRYRASNASAYPATEKKNKEKILSQGGWSCSCGRINHAYVTTCPCGKSKREQLLAGKTEALQAQDAPTDPLKEEISKAAAIKSYKELVDCGAITQEEYEAKKKQLLDI